MKYCKTVKIKRTQSVGNQKNAEKFYPESRVNENETLTFSNIKDLANQMGDCLS